MKLQAAWNDLIERRAPMSMSISILIAMAVAWDALSNSPCAVLSLLSLTTLDANHEI